MKAQEKEEKDEIKFQYAVGLYNALKDSSFGSFRKLAREAGMEPAHIQKISVGKLDVSLTTNVAIADALQISYSRLAEYYDNVTEKDREEFVLYLENQKTLKGKRKIKLTKNGQVKTKNIPKKAGKDKS